MSLPRADTFEFQVRHFAAVKAYRAEPSHENLLALMDAIVPGARSLPLAELPALMAIVNAAMTKYEACLTAQQDLYRETFGHLYVPNAVPCPPEYTRHQFCEYIWHCPPSVFDEQKLSDYISTITMKNAETEAREANSPKSDSVSLD